MLALLRPYRALVLLTLTSCACAQVGPLRISISPANSSVVLGNPGRVVGSTRT